MEKFFFFLLVQKKKCLHKKIVWITEHPKSDVHYTAERRLDWKPQHHCDSPQIFSNNYLMSEL